MRSFQASNKKTKQFSFFLQFFPSWPWATFALPFFTHVPPPLCIELNILHLIVHMMLMLMMMLCFMIIEKMGEIRKVLKFKEHNSLEMEKLCFILKEVDLLYVSYFVVLSLAHGIFFVLIDFLSIDMM